MDSDTWIALNELLDAALEVPPDERGQWVESLGPEFEPIRSRLRTLVAHSARIETNDFLGTLPKVDTTSAVGAPDRQAGDAVGPYRLLEPLGSGGMGAVWLAERSDGLIDRPVALKLPHANWLAAGLAERMARERAILATLNHPNIARLYDAGLTEEGQPFLALEYVEGIPIDAYCRDRGLDRDARIGLFLAVAHAVAYAHEKLVVHRDLKPANILVTDDGQVRLLDFGIGKILGDGPDGDSALTRMSGQLMTPDYASPEQIRGGAITVRSDVYSLGVLLYELLTGARPYRLGRDSAAALEEAILHTEPRAPSECVTDRRLRRGLRGDVDTIVLKALKKDPDARYATVNAFVDDLERHRTGRAVLARPDSVGYKIGKFVRRNRLPVGAAAAVLATILVGAGTALWQARVALAEKERAEEVKDFIASIFREADPYRSQGKTLSAVELLEQAQDEIGRSLRERPELQVELFNIVGESLLQLQAIGNAEEVVNASSTIAAEHLAADDPEALRTRLLMVSVHRFRGRTTEMREELALLIPALMRDPDAYEEQIVEALKARAHAAIDEAAYEEAEAAAQEARSFALARFGERHAATVTTYNILAMVYTLARNRDSALETAELALRSALALEDGNSQHPLVIDTRLGYAQALGTSGRAEDAVTELMRVAEDATAVFGANSVMVGYSHANAVEYQLDLGQVEAALASSARAAAIHAQHSEPDSFTIGASHNTRAMTLLVARRSDEAVREFSEAHRIAEKLLGPEHDVVFKVRSALALALALAGRIDESAALLSETRATLEDLGRPVPASVDHASGVVARLQEDFASALALQQSVLESGGVGAAGLLRARRHILTEIGLNHAGLGEVDRAAASFEAALELFAEHEDAPTPQRSDALVGLGRARMEQGRIAEAASLFEQADAFWRDFDPDNRWAGEAALRLGLAYRALGRVADAEAVLARARPVLAASPIPSDADLLVLADRR